MVSVILILLRGKYLITLCFQVTKSCVIHCHIIQNMQYSDHNMYFILFVAVTIALIRYRKRTLARKEGMTLSVGQGVLP